MVRIQYKVFTPIDTLMERTGVVVDWLLQNFEKGLRQAAYHRCATSEPISQWEPDLRQNLLVNP